MGSVKPEWVKPSVDLSYPEGVKVKANEAIAQNDIVCVVSVIGGDTAHYGGAMVVARADATNVAKASGRLLIAKHAIPSGGYGVCVPWRTIAMNTTGTAVGNSVYLGATGAVVAASGLAAGSKVLRQVGTVAVVGNATVGRVVLAPESPATAPVEAIDYAGGSGGSEVVWELDVAAGGTTTPVTIPFPVRIIDAWVVSEDAAGGNMKATLATADLVALAVSGTPKTITRATLLDNRSAAAGGVLDTAKTGGTTVACKLYVKGIVNI